MINQLVRYAPLLKELKSFEGSLLEVGSGDEGIATYLRRRTFGLEIAFAGTPSELLIACQGTATDLPFADNALDTVLIMDTMEHIPANLRERTIRESCRVAAKRVIVGGPMGPKARAADDALAAAYARRELPIPDWLAEHLERQAPDIEDIQRWFGEAGWTTRVQGNENLDSHVRLMRFELTRYGGRIAHRIRKHAGSLAARAARVRSRPPYYSYFVFAKPAT